MRGWEKWGCSKVRERKGAGREEMNANVVSVRAEEFVFYGTAELGNKGAGYRGIERGGGMALRRGPIIDHSRARTAQAQDCGHLTLPEHTTHGKCGRLAVGIEPTRL